MTDIERKAELQREYIKAKRKLEEYKLKRKNSANEIKELEELINKLQAHKKKIENALDGILSTIFKRSASLNPNSKLRDNYNREAKKIIKGQNSSRAFERINSAINKSKRKILELDDNVEYYNQKVNYYQNRVNELRIQINSIQV